MQKSMPIFLLLSFLLSKTCVSQSQEWSQFASINVSKATGQDYNPWLNDDLNDLVKNVWSKDNLEYVTVTLNFKKKTTIFSLLLYDYQGTFERFPASIYATIGSEKKFIGNFSGKEYEKWVEIKLGVPISADGIAIYKYGNNIPHKIKVFGLSETKERSKIQFSSLPDSKLGEDPFHLVASSNNLETPVIFTSANPSVVKVSNINGKWIATALSTGTTNIIASQAGNAKFLGADSVAQPLAVLPASGPSTTASVKIPIDPKRWYDINTYGQGLGGLFDGNIKAKVEAGYGRMFENYDSYYPLLDMEEMTIDSIRFYDGQGSFQDKPMTLSVINDKWERTTIASFTGSLYDQWITVIPQAMIERIRFLSINSWIGLPNEVEIYGRYKPGIPLPVLTSKKQIKFRETLGVNAYEWNFEDGNSPSVINSRKMTAVKNFTGVRHYMDWEKLESLQGQYSFNPTISGGWNYDAIYEKCKEDGIQVLACLKTIPKWIENTYPVGRRDYENVPAKYGSNLNDPKSYIEQAKVAFQFAARYGSNTAVDKGLLSVNRTPRWANDIPNSVKVGLNLIDYIECDNERDKGWKGRQAYQTGREYAANLSAFYDGHKNTMGPGVGVKNADPQMKVVIGGLAGATLDYERGMIDWCKQFRGYKKDGKIDLCWDVFNHHLYANDAQSSQNGGGTRGTAPELSGIAEQSESFSQLAFGYGMPVWITEVGYDINPGSPFKAIPIGNKSALETQADWILRSCLLFARSGIDKVFFYQLYDDQPELPVQFYSMGLINGDHTRKPAADYLSQVGKLFGEYAYQETLNQDPIVDRYELNGHSGYVLVVPDERGREEMYKLSLPGINSAYLYTPKIGSDTMQLKKVKIAAGSLTVNVTETPLFVIPQLVTSNKVLANSTGNQPVEFNSEKFLKQDTLAGKSDFRLSFFPNPSKNVLNIQFTVPKTAEVSLAIIDFQGKTMTKTNLGNLMAGTFKRVALNIESLPSAMYLIQLTSNNKTISQKMVKLD